MMAPSSQILTQGGIRTRDWFSDKLLGGGGVNISKHVDNVDAQLDMKDLHGSFSFMLQRSHNLIRLSSKLIKCHINVYINHNKSA